MIRDTLIKALVTSVVILMCPIITGLFSVFLIGGTVHAIWLDKRRTENKDTEYWS